MATKITIFGHSYVRRLHELMFSRQDLHNLGLDSARFQISCIGIGGLKLQQRQRLHSSDHLLAGQDLVIIDIGSNDLCLENYVPEQFALDIVSYCSFLTEGLGVKRVAISQILTRSIEPFHEYNQHVIRANVAIQHILSTCDFPVVLWKHRGMWNSQKTIHCADGVHLSLDIGYPKYIRSLRDCIIRLHNK
jgi:lysophospholipase L1-like esterase